MVILQHLTQRLRQHYRDVPLLDATRASLRLSYKAKIGPGNTTSSTTKERESYCHELVRLMH